MNKLINPKIFNKYSANKIQHLWVLIVESPWATKRKKSLKSERMMLINLNGAIDYSYAAQALVKSAGAVVSVYVFYFSEWIRKYTELTPTKVNPPMFLNI